MAVHTNYCFIAPITPYVRWGLARVCIAYTCEAAADSGVSNILLLSVAEDEQASLLSIVIKRLSTCHRRRSSSAPIELGVNFL
jgi:hypothetical protein